MKTADEFWSSLVKQPGGCWEWQGAHGRAGHGQLRFQKERWIAHRLAFFLVYGIKPEVVMHKCDNPPCCNPDHLQAGTAIENFDDMRRKGRNRNGTRRGTDSPIAKYTIDQVQAMREEHERGATFTALAKKYNSHPIYISRLIRGLRGMGKYT